MTLNYLEGMLRRGQEPGDVEFAQTVVDFLNRRRKDIPLPDWVGGKLGVEKQVLEEPLKTAIEEFKTGYFMPRVATTAFSTIWQERGNLFRQYFHVVGCDRSVEELIQIKKDGRRIGYLPRELSRPEGRFVLGKMFGLEDRMVLRGLTVPSNQENRYGWFDYEASLLTPYVGTTEDELKDLFARQGRKGMNYNEFLVACLDSDLFDDAYLDIQTSSRLLGSQVGNERTIAVSTFGFNLSKIGINDRNFRQDNLGGRSVRYKTLQLT